MQPIKKCEQTQAYGRKNTAYAKGYHTGIDYAARGTDSSIYAVAPGTVIRARFAAGRRGADPKGWGNYLIVRTEDGHDLIYAHLASVAVIQGIKVATGDRLGLQGSTGNSTGAHLHLEVRQGDWQQQQDIDPLAYLQKLETPLVPEPGIKVKLHCQCGDLLDELPGVMIEGQVYGPVRGLMEGYGHLVSWDGDKVDVRPK